MNTATLYRDLTVQGVTLYLDGGALRYRAPKGKMTPDVIANIKTHKVELVSLLANDHCKKYINNIESIVRESNRESDNISTWSMDRYAHLVTCHQCEHLTATGYCRVKPQYKPLTEAMRECDSFKLLKSERLSIVKVTPYTATELLSHYEKPLYNHLLTCPLCHVEAAQYCLYGDELGKQYDALLLKQEDAQERRTALALQVDRACISGRSVLNRVTHASVLNRSKMRHNKDA